MAFPGWKNDVERWKKCVMRDCVDTECKTVEGIDRVGKEQRTISHGGHLEQMLSHL